MSILGQLADDLLRVLVDHDDLALELGEAECNETQLRQLLIQHIDNLGPDLPRWLASWQGNRLPKLLEKCEAKPLPKNVGPEAVARQWLDSRGVRLPVASADPQRSYRYLRETINQFKDADISVFLAQKAVPELIYVLNYVVLYHAQAANVDDKARLLSRISDRYCVDDLFVDMTCLRREKDLDNAVESLLSVRESRFPPYSSSGPASDLLSAAEVEYLRELVTLSGVIKYNYMDSSASRYFCDIVQKLFSSWDACGTREIVPKGAVVFSTSKGMYGWSVQCRDEFDRTVTVDGLKRELYTGDNVLLDPSADGAHWGGTLMSLRFSGEERSAPEAFYDDLFEKPNRLNMRTERSKIVPKTESVILHLSDLHFNGTCDPKVEFGPLREDLEDKVDGLGLERVDFLIVSGDFTERASEEEFAKAAEFLSLLVDYLGIAKSFLVLTPGNHDIDWETRVYEWYSNRVVSADNANRESMVAQGQGFLVRQDSVYSSRFKNFSDYLYKPLLGRDYTLDASRQYVCSSFPGHDIQLLAFNSCWEIDEHFPDRSSIHQGALARCLEDSGKEPLSDAKVLKIGVWHHPVIGNEKIHDDAFLEQLRKKDVELCLHGHVHEERVGLLGHYETRQLHVVGAGSFGATSSARPESTPSLYNVLVVDRSNSSIRVFMRCRRRRGGAFTGWSVVPGSTPLEKRSMFEIEL